MSLTYEKDTLYTGVKIQLTLLQILSWEGGCEFNIRKRFPLHRRVNTIDIIASPVMGGGM